MFSLRNILIKYGGKKCLLKTQNQPGSKLLDHEIVLLKYSLPKNYVCMITFW